jgi:hypothetical protein
MTFEIEQDNAWNSIGTPQVPMTFAAHLTRLQRRARTACPVLKNIRERIRR